jgi:hypothetical protein
MAPGPAHPEHEPVQLDDLGDAEVAAAEAAIAHENLPELEQAPIPPVPAVEPVPEVAGALPPDDREVTAPDLANTDAKGQRA